MFLENVTNWTSLWRRMCVFKQPPLFTALFGGVHLGDWELNMRQTTVWCNSQCYSEHATVYHLSKGYNQKDKYMWQSCLSIEIRKQIRAVVMSNLKWAHSSPSHLGGAQKHIPRTSHFMEEQRSQDSCLLVFSYSEIFSYRFVHGPCSKSSLKQSLKELGI